MVIDSSGWIEYFADGPLADRYAAYIEGSQRIIVPTVIVYEVYKKILRDAGQEPAIEAMAVIRKMPVVPLTEELSLLVAEVSLKHRLPMADAIVYATAQANDALVVTSDQHFMGLPDVEFIARQTT